MKIIKTILCCCALLIIQQSLAMESETVYHKEERQFISQMQTQYHYNADTASDLIYNIKFLPDVIKHMQKPYEAKPWYIYRKYFVTQKRIAEGIKYAKQNQTDLTRAEQQYGVPKSIIVSIIGVETFYGEYEGDYPVLNALATLAFAYPPRAKFFRAELVQYLLLTQELNFDPRKVKGSYAGAMGMPQFMPSSYRHYAVDFSGRKRKDLFHNSADVIGSVANYLNKAGWIKGQLIAVPAKITGTKYKKLLNAKLKPIYTVAQLKTYGVEPTVPLPGNTKVNIIQLQYKNSFQYWIGLKNFYAITRYNTSIHYAMAVLQLANKISVPK